MSDRSGDKLYVNLGPSQVRKRLKGFGHGVRQVQSAGRNQSVIIHTAIGRHLELLEAKFADVGTSRRPQQSEPIDNLPNLGPTSALWLREAGVRTIDDLERLGPVAAYRLVRHRQERASLNLLWSLAAGLTGRKWTDLTDEEKERLRRELAELE